MTKAIRFDIATLNTHFRKDVIYSLYQLSNFVTPDCRSPIQIAVSAGALIDDLLEYGFQVEGYDHDIDAMEYLVDNPHSLNLLMSTNQTQQWAEDLGRLGAQRAIQPLRGEDIESTFEEADWEKIHAAQKQDEEAGDQDLRQHIIDQTASRSIQVQRSQVPAHHRTHKQDPNPGRCPSPGCNSISIPNYRHCGSHVRHAVDLLHHPIQQKWQEELKWLRSLKDNPDRFLILDTEFQIFKFACPVAFEVCFRTYNGEIVLQCTVDYGGLSVEELIDKYCSLCPPGFEFPQAVLNRIRAGFSRMYPDGKARGSSFTEMKEILIKKGFNPATHAIVSYGTTIDLQICWKILAGINQPFIVPSVKDTFMLGTEKRTCLQPVNIYHLARQMMTCTDYSLKTVYRHLYGREDVKLHRAGPDTLIMLDVVRALTAL